MAVCIWQRMYLTFFLTSFMTLSQSSFPVFFVDRCAGNLSEIEAATLRLNCSDAKGFINVYHCLPLSNLSQLVEFCYNGISGLIEKGNCMVLEGQHLNNYPCNHFTNGCPNTTYFPKNMFDFPACIQINKENRCYIAEPSCPLNKSQTAQPKNYTKVDLTLAVLFPTVFVGLVVFSMILLALFRHRLSRRGMYGTDGTEIECKERTPLIETDFSNKETDEENLNEIQMNADDEFWKRYQKYLDEGSVKVCPISQILIVGEHGVGKTTLLYRLQGRSREEIEAIRSTRGIQRHTEKQSFIITKNQLKINLRGIGSLSADPEQVLEFSAEKGNDEEEDMQKTIPDSPAKVAMSNKEAETPERENLDEKQTMESKSDETMERNIPDEHIDHQTTFSDIEKENTQEIDHNKQTDQYLKPEENGEIKQDSQLDFDEQPDHERQTEQKEEKNDKEEENDTQSFISSLIGEMRNRQKTASQFGNQDDVVLDVLDFAGQGEYYASHQTYIRKDALFILVINTAKNLFQKRENFEMENKTERLPFYKNQFLCDRPGVAFSSWSPKDYFYYWLNTVRMHGGSSENMIFVGTHKDQKRSDFDFDLLLDDSLAEKLLPKRYFAPIVIDLSRYDEETENNLAEVKNNICELINRQGRELRPAKWVKYSVMFDIIKRQFPFVQIEKVLEMIDHFDLKMSDTEVADMLHFFHNCGKIIFFNMEKLNEIVILDPQWFIDCFKHIISNRKHVEEDCRIVDSQGKKMLRNFCEKGVLEVSLYDKLLNQKGNIPLEYGRTLGEYQSKLGMMFFVENYRIDDSDTVDGWYVPSINTQEFKPDIKEYGGKESSQILCFKFKTYLPHDLFGRVIVACLNSGNWRPYNFRLCKSGADMCYKHSIMPEEEQIYLFTSQRIITVQFIGKHSDKNGQIVGQEIGCIVRQICQFYACAPEYEVGFLCNKEKGYEKNSVDHFVSRTKEEKMYCQGCSKRTIDEWKEAELFWKYEFHEVLRVLTRKEMDPLQISCKVYFHVVKRYTEIAAEARTQEGVSRKTYSTWLNGLVKIGEKLRDLQNNPDVSNEEKENNLKTIDRYLKNIVWDQRSICRDLRKEIFFTWTQNTDNPLEGQGIPGISLEISREKVQDGTNMTLEAKCDVQILRYLWFRSTFLENELHLITQMPKCEFVKTDEQIAMTMKRFDLQDEGYYYVVVETENGCTVCRRNVISTEDGSHTHNSESGLGQSVKNDTEENPTVKYNENNSTPVQGQSERDQEDRKRKTMLSEISKLKDVFVTE